MDRRQFLWACAAMSACGAARAAGEPHVTYSPEAYAAALASGKPLLLDFYAPW